MADFVELITKFSSTGYDTLNAQLSTAASKATQTARATDGLTRALKNAGSGARQAERATDGYIHALQDIRLGVQSTIRQIAGLVGMYKMLEAATATLNRGIKFDQSWESSKLSIASVIGSVTQLADAQGHVLTGAEKFTASQQLAEDMMRRIQILGLETTATTEELVLGVQGIIAPATRAGVALEKIPDLAVNVAQAMGAMQIPLQQMRTEADALLSGNINKAQDILATNLGITSQMVKQWREQGTLVDEINKRLEIFKFSGEAIANTWSGLSSNLKEYLDFVSGKATTHLFDDMKRATRQLQNLLIVVDNSGAKVNPDIQNLLDAYTRLNYFIGEKLFQTVKDFSDFIKELNDPQNLSELEETLKNIWGTAETATAAIKNISSLSWDFMKSALHGFNALPEPIREYGLIAAIILGKTGKTPALAALGFLTATIGEIKGMYGDLEDVVLGKATGAELARKRLKEKGWEDENEAVSYPEYRGLYERPKRKILVLGSSNTASGGLTDSQKNKIDSARNYLVSLRAEIERINGTGEDFGIKLVQKLDEIEKKAKVAGLSLHEIQTLKDAYSSASISKLYRDQSDALRDVDIQIATMRGDAAKVRMLEVEKATDELTRKLTQLQISEPERASKVTEFKVAKEQEFQIKDLQTAADFYQKLADLSGNYNATTEYQNQLLEAQARIYAESLGPGHEKYIEQWKELMQLQNSRDYADGITRGLKKWTGEYTNMAMQMEGFTTSTLDAMTEGLLDFTSRTSASFSDMTRSILQDLARITARMAMAGLIKTAVGFFSAPGGGTATASVSGNSISGGWAEGFMSRGSSYAAIVKHGGGMALEPSPTRRVPASFFEGAPRYHTGFINPAYERAAIIRTDESVLTPGQMKAIAGAGGASVVNNIAIVPPDGYEGKEARTANATGGEDIRVTFGRIAAQQANTYGSELNVALRRQGTRMPVMRSGG
ncbi:phage tail tape measure C-terminal domain-containing protein [Bilophila wadsworthia]|uniref:phage tail tape measure C-terminal domain-containing protein n=1 Tax=Bilophila wadsworthia TaxID=35833 RepID=UPI002432F1F8|nr:phage tail tape measure C-terminal domain-containing protein [Bilophila wadsworthia]